MQNNLFCRVCGLKHLDPPWGEDGNTPSFEICACCGTEFGYEDCQLVSIRKQREKWLSNGAKWRDQKFKPADWNLEEQLSNIPAEFK